MHPEQTTYDEMLHMAVLWGRCEGGGPYSQAARVPVARWNNALAGRGRIDQGQTAPSRRVSFGIPTTCRGRARFRIRRSYPAIAIVGAEQLPGYQDSDHGV